MYLQIKYWLEARQQTHTMTGDDYNTITNTDPQQKPYIFIYTVHVYLHVYTHDLLVYCYKSQLWLATQTYDLPHIYMLI